MSSCRFCGGAVYTNDALCSQCRHEDDQASLAREFAGDGGGEDEE